MDQRTLQISRKPGIDVNIPSTEIGYVHGIGGCVVEKEISIGGVSFRGAGRHSDRNSIRSLLSL